MRLKLELIHTVLFYFISEPVSLAKTLLRYTSDDARILSFEKNVDCEIYSKSAGSRVDLWGAKVFQVSYLNDLKNCNCI
jgi:hypothetical protein